MAKKPNKPQIGDVRVEFLITPTEQAKQAVAAQFKKGVEDFGIQDWKAVAERIGRSFEEFIRKSEPTRIAHLQEKGLQQIRGHKARSAPRTKSQKQRIEKKSALRMEIGSMLGRHADWRSSRIAMDLIRRGVSGNYTHDYLAKMIERQRKERKKV